MKTKSIFICILLLCSFVFSNAQKATIRGIVFNENHTPVANVNIKTTAGGTTSNANGFYILEIPANTVVTVDFTHILLKKTSSTFNLKKGESIEFNPVMKTSIEQIATVVITNNQQKNVTGITTLSPETIRAIPGANPGVENLLLSLPGVNNNNELSTQYSVRGGNYDENLVYVNDIEIYRPFLVRSGQQEGLSFVNTDLVKNVDFSAGGFQAKYGDKLSSVLDITYKTPYQFEASADLSLLGLSTSIAGISKDSKFSGIAGIRYRNNSMLVNAKETQTNFKPTFADIQTYLTYTFSNKFHLSFLGNAAINKYNYKPEFRQTNFGTVSEPIALSIYYNGQEKDRYQTYFGAFKGTYHASKDLSLKLIAATYHTTEEEYFDILAQYYLGEVNSNIGDENFGEVEYNEGVGGQLNHGRNDLDALITNIEHKGSYTKNNNLIEWSLKYTNEDIRDRLVEWEVIDSAGFSIRPPKATPINEQPYTPYSGPLEAYKNIQATNYTQINRFQAYVQWSKRSKIGNNQVWYNAGIRAHNWMVSGRGIPATSQIVFSPRAQFSIKPDWNKDMLFRVASGIYYQPPFYKELRNTSGIVQPEVKAQQAIHFVLGNDYSFTMWNRPFKLVSEAYYKHLSNVNPYTLENVRIRYTANNNAKAYAYGLDLRLNGEFVPGTESWFGFGYLKTEQNINNQGYIARPTDQRLKFSALFQDYIPNMPQLKVYLNLVYNTGLPGGSPSYANPYNYQNRLPDYKRADLGLQYVLIDNKTKHKGWKKTFKELTFGFEIYNMFDVQNSITNTWVRDVYSKRQYAIPNYLTPRVFNIRTIMKF